MGIAVRSVALLALLALAGGCVHYPKVEEAGSPHIRPENARAVRQADGLAVYVDLRSSGKFGDVITGAQTPVAREAKLVDASGAAVQRVEVPGYGVLPLKPGAPHVVLSGLTRAVSRGEVFIVTLLLEKSGRLGVVTVVE
jgi:copper(I)-binding protein